MPYMGRDEPKAGKFHYDPKDFPDKEELERVRAIVFPVALSGVSKADETDTIRAVYILRQKHRKTRIPRWITWLIFKFHVLDPAFNELPGDEERRQWPAVVARLKTFMMET